MLFNKNKNQTFYILFLYAHHKWTFIDILIFFIISLIGIGQ